MVDVLGRPCCEDCFDDCLNRGKGSARSSRNPSPASKAVGMISNPRSRTPGPRRDSELDTPLSNPGGLKKSASQPGLNPRDQISPVVEELARRIGAVSPSRKDGDGSPVTRSVPTREGKAQDEKPPSSPSRSIADRLAALHTGSPSGSATGSPPKRFSAIDFGTPSKLSHSVSSASLQSAASTPTGKLMSQRTGESTATKDSSDKAESLIKSPLPVNRPISGLLTPGSTPTQSPMGTPPTRSVNITSPPGSNSKIPSLRGRHSISTISSPPRTSSPGINNQPSTPNRKLSNSISSAISPMLTGSRIPPASSPKSSVISPAKGTPFKSNLATIASSPASSKANSPSSTIASGNKGGRPSLTIPIPPADEQAKCGKCGELLYSVQSSGRTVSVPAAAEGEEAQRYHADCFRCDACDGVFAENDGSASFVRYEGSVRHLECTPSQRIQTIRHPTHESPTPVRDFGTAVKNTTVKNNASRPNPRPTSTYGAPSAIPKRTWTGHRSSNSLSSTPSGIPALRSSATAPRFGSTTTCPGCKISVSPMERGIVPGPAATKWHASCLVCGGKNNAKRASGMWKSRDEVKGPGCGKKLDSAAKGDVSEGVLWCRGCWDIAKDLGIDPASPSSSLSPTLHSSTSIFPTAPRPGSSLGTHSTGPLPIGTTTLARQMSRAGATSPVRRQYIFPPPTPTIAEGEAVSEQKTGDPTPRPASSIGTYTLSGRISPFKEQLTGGKKGAGNPVRAQYTGTLRSISPVRRTYTGVLSTGVDGVEPEPLAIQFTGGGVPITRQLTTRRPKSALGTRSFGSQKSVDEGRGMFLVRQMTGHAEGGDES
ncbi:hypothetical protein FRB99_003499 [Tulasnella sp. 403]|nr:hypothetical protein FRB99_003499 [Tulasnella sp. 403]